MQETGVSKCSMDPLRTQQNFISIYNPNAWILFCIFQQLSSSSYCTVYAAVRIEPKVTLVLPCALFVCSKGNFNFVAQIIEWYSLFFLFFCFVASVRYTYDGQRTKGKRNSVHDVERCLLGGRCSGSCKINCTIISIQVNIVYIMFYY